MRRDALRPLSAGVGGAFVPATGRVLDSETTELSGHTIAWSRWMPADLLDGPVGAAVASTIADPAVAAALAAATEALNAVRGAVGTEAEPVLRVALHEARSEVVRAVTAVSTDLGAALDAARAAAATADDRVELALLSAVEREGRSNQHAAALLLAGAEVRARDLSNSPLLLAVLVARGRALVLAGDRPGAVRVLHDGIALASAMGARRQQAKLLGNLGFLHSDFNAEAYERYTRETLVLAVESGDERVEAQALCNLGGALSQLGRHDEASATLKQALVRAEALGMSDTVALTRAAIGGVLCAIGSVNEGIAEYVACHAYFVRAGNLFQMTRQRLIIGRHLLAAGRLDDARTWLERCVQTHDGVRFGAMIQQAYAMLSEIGERQGDVVGALAALRHASRLGEALFDTRVQEQTRLLELQVAASEAARDAETERRQNAELRDALRELERLRDELERQMRTDLLTGVSNRGRLQELVEHEIAVGRRCCRPIAVVLIDVDHFKRVNDTHGHLVGDAVLIEVARRLTRTVRDHDCVARWGGEEFCVALFGADDSTASAVAERLVSAIRTAPIPTDAGPVSVTISAGVAHHVDPDANMAPMLSRADQALYRAKRDGRDRAVVYGRPGGTPITALEAVSGAETLSR